MTTQQNDSPSKARRFATVEITMPPIRHYDDEAIKALRERLQISQATLATVLNASLSTVRQWEIGQKHPCGPSAKLLDLLDRKGLDGLR